MHKLDVKDFYDNMLEIYSFLSLFSHFLTIVILRKPAFVEYDCFKSFFKVSEEQLEQIVSWMDMVKSRADQTLSRNRNNADCLQVCLILRKYRIIFSDYYLNIIPIFQIIECLEFHILVRLKRVMRKD